jgi:hypothetical protein
LGAGALDGTIRGNIDDDSLGFGQAEAHHLTRELNRQRVTQGGFAN